MLRPPHSPHLTLPGWQPRIPQRTYLDPVLEDPQPQTCRGRGELGKALRRQAGQGLRAELEEVIAAGEKVIVVLRTPGSLTDERGRMYPCRLSGTSITSASPSEISPR
jgi:hypothetical protein